MTDDDFLRQILANPSDVSLRLVYADWLEEHGDPRAEFLRLIYDQRQLSLDDLSFTDQQARLNELRLHIDAEWLAAVDPLFAEASFRGIINAKAFGTFAPYSTGLAKEIEGHLRRVVADLSRSFEVEADFMGYGSGYSSYVPVFCWKHNELSTTWRSGKAIIDGILVWLCRLAPVAVWGKATITRNPGPNGNRGTSEFLSSKLVRPMPMRGWEDEIRKIEHSLNLFGFSLPSRKELERKLPFEAQIATNLNFSQYVVFDAFFYWAD